MKAKRFGRQAWSVLMVLGLSVMNSACNDEDEKKTPESATSVEAVLQAEEAVEGSLTSDHLAGLKVTITEVRSGDETSATLDADGTAHVTLKKGMYNFAIEQAVEAENEDESAYILYARKENVPVGVEGQTVTLAVNITVSEANGENFIFSELFFNGEKNSGRMMHPDQYFVIYNPTAQTLYADGVCVAVTQHISWWEKQVWYDDFYPTEVPIGGFVTIPGSGKEHPVKPGEKLVVAFTAVDHSAVEGYDHAVDLSGADFEIYYGPESTDTDNPDVPNVILTENNDDHSYGFFMQPRGYVSPLMFKLENGNESTVRQFYRDHTVKKVYTETVKDEEGNEHPESVEYEILAVPVEMITDGVQTSDEPMDVVTRCIPESVDRGKVLVAGCHSQYLVIRREVNAAGAKYYKDTNDSSADFEVKVGQNAYPVGWRNK